MMMWLKAIRRCPIAQKEEQLVLSYGYLDPGTNGEGAYSY